MFGTSGGLWTSAVGLVWLLLSVIPTVLAQDVTMSLGIAATGTASPTIPITPPSQRPLATCSADPLWRRLRNADGIDPCTLAMNLQRTCTTIDPIPALTGGESYSGPTDVAAATPCICTTVMYNLVAACAACQHQRSNNVSRNWVPWNTWSALCPNRDQIADGTWNRATLYNSTIPSWAYAKVFQSDWFDLQQAVNIGVSSTSAAPSATSLTSTASPSNHDALAGIIIGAVLGGIGVLLLFLTCLFCFLRRKQRKWEETEGVNRPQPAPYIQSKRPASPQNQYGPGGLLSPVRGTYDDKPRPLQVEAALPDVAVDEHQQGKPYGYGYGHGDYAPVANPGVAGVGAGGRGLAAPTPVHRVAPKDNGQGFGQHELNREGIFREDFSASEGHGYRSSNDIEPRQFQNPSAGLHGNGDRGGLERGPHPPSSYPYSTPAIPGRTGGGGIAPMGAGATTLTVTNPDEDVHAYSTVGDASISLYPPSVEHHVDPPPRFAGGFSPPAEKDEFNLPERGYSSGYVLPESSKSGVSGESNERGDPKVEADPFAANRRPAAFNRVFGDRLTPPTPAAPAPAPAPTTSRGGAPAMGARRRSGPGSPLFMRNMPLPNPSRRAPGPGSPPQDMGFGRRTHSGTGAPGRDSSGFSDASSPTAVGYPGDVGGQDDGSPPSTGPTTGRSGFGIGRKA